MKLHFIKLEAILKRLQGPFGKEFGELQYESPAVMNSQSRKLNISRIPKNVEVEFAHIFQRARHFIFTQNADHLTKPKTEQK